MIANQVNPLEGFNIEFKKIDPSDFNNEYYSVEKENIESVDGFITDNLTQKLANDLFEQNTLVINAGTGQGKTKSILDLVKKYTETNNHIVIIAVPSKNLIEQYVKDCTDKLQIQDKRVFNLLEIEEYNFLGGTPKKMSKTDLNKIFLVNDTDVLGDPTIEDFKIHVLTTNALLGNSGEDSLFQNAFRRKYFEKLLKYCKTKNKKLVVVYDEIHDSISNFKEEYIFSLWKYQGIIFKNYIISATFNEASKEVIKYLSEFTDRKIKIIESERKVFANKQGRLHLIFNDYKKYHKLEHLTSLINNCITNDYSFDIISYSKLLIKELVKYTALNDISEKLNYCYSEDLDFDDIANKRFTNEKINLGTNFSTGANIEKNNHKYIIILPKRTTIEFFKNKGVFTSGYNALIQTIARQRIPGDIYIYMPTPYNLAKSSLPFDDKSNNKVSEYFNKFSKKEVKVSYSNINYEQNILSEVYFKLLQINLLADQNIRNTNREGMNSLSYFTKERFILLKGENYLSSQFFNGDISTFTFYYAITNQFLNCKLSTIYSNNTIELDEEDFISDISSIYNDYAEQLVIDEMPFIEEDIVFKEVRIKDYVSEFTILNDILEHNDFDNILIGDKKATYQQQIKIKRHLLIQIMTKGGEEVSLDSENINKLLAKSYFNSCVRYATENIYVDENGKYYKLISEKYRCYFDSFNERRIAIYYKWKRFIDLIDSEVNLTDGLLSIEPSDVFKELFQNEKMDEELNELINIDRVLKNEFFSFKDSYERTKDKTTYFFKLLIDSFFERNEKYKFSKKKRFHQDVKIKDLNSIQMNFLYEKLPEEIL
ncbi:DEAD/DEAH box helicase family protein [Chryseobacterium arthrosphaerae]|uniref:DEAD/DEAH box helicase family protein n=1 Tax=Chryseobacterium arthrosphaerae TaxID=651561 RepID=UPI001E414C85|nr:DEAD/DEAH box helicase family protein [Chryseobacterium arthrosphaerae]UEQ75911.1 DEAD/DEAH box helicase family protein [Chryseobacterium arthrosphaerae]